MARSRSENCAATFIVVIFVLVELFIAFNPDNFRKHLLLGIRVSIYERNLVTESDFLWHFVFTGFDHALISYHNVIAVAVDSDSLCAAQA